MSKALELIQNLARRGEIRVSLHGYEELASDNIRVHDAVTGLQHAIVIEDYPNYPKGALRAGARVRCGKPADPCSLGPAGRERYARCARYELSA